jgi:tetratricopeptide (TPR) repeat protein
MTTDPNTSGNHNEDVTNDNLRKYEKGLDLAEAGKYEEALEYMQERLGTTPDDAEVLNDTGAILHCLGRSDEAIDHFVKARSVRNDSAEILWNLAEAYLAVGKASEAAQVFDEMDELGVLNADTLNRTAEVFLNQDNKAGALEMLLRSLVLLPEQEILYPMVEVIRFKRPKVAFFCDENATGAVNEIARFVKERFAVHFLEDGSEDQVRELMKWSDISWFEWGSDLAVTGSKQQKVCKNIIGRHGDEENPQWSQAVNWDNIDVQLTVGDRAAKETLSQELHKVNKVLVELEAEIESEQTKGHFCDNLQARTSEEAALSAQSAAATFEEN